MEVLILAGTTEQVEVAQPLLVVVLLEVLELVVLELLQVLVVHR
jgi:hypothetical protein